MELYEKVARHICKNKGIDPDRIFEDYSKTPSQKMWRVVQVEVKDVLKALSSMDYVILEKQSNCIW